MRQPTEVLLRRAGHRERLDAGLLRGDHVHHHAAGVHGETAGHVEPDPAHRYPALGDGAAVRHDRRGVGAALVAVDGTCPPDRLLQRRSYRRVELVDGLVQLAGRDTQVVDTNAVEPLAQVAQRLGATVPDVVADRADGVQGCLDVEGGAGDGAAQLARVELEATQVESTDHAPRLRGARAATR